VRVALHPRRLTCKAVAETKGSSPAPTATGRIKNVTSAQIPQLMSEGWTVLDVRPPGEHAKARIPLCFLLSLVAVPDSYGRPLPGPFTILITIAHIVQAALETAVHAPLFLEDPSNSLDTLIKKAAALSMGGWWLGGTHYIPNPDFLSQVMAALPDKDAKVLVVCQKGLRSLTACEALSRAGYSTLAWLNGGLDTARPGEMATKDGVDVRMGGIGGLTEALGWTEVQKETGQGFFGGSDNVLKLFAGILVLDGIWFLWTAKDALLK
jgi:rhodanese-related sulfurtransferase